ncbi:SDR family oxidoreductase [Paractinoplanes hotanensis]|uniref:SDR family oxidoreductase n=1 Tax=Paractinoplanes hotanensis TaxID=2906497 RepID=A0ABT0YBE6_9ACTN|nr:SDR family oxidoreductase [Actinoplanes hotanensis]MCM4082802.1 SDR family oxidoreductase [Actinoplanes hotanensis]
MRMAVAGGTGWVGKLLVEKARAAGHEVVVMSRSTGVDLTTGAGLDEALRGVDVVIDVVNIETLSRKAAIAFFESTTRHLLAAEEKAGVKHHVALSIVGVDRVDSGYYAGKRRQEELVLAGPIPATVLRATQFHEFAAQVLARVPGPVKVAPVMVTRPVAAADVAAELVRLAEGPAQGLGAEIAGPEVLRLADMMRRVAPGKLVLSLRLPDAASRAMARDGLLPIGQFRQGGITFEKWAATR